MLNMMTRSLLALFISGGATALMAGGQPVGKIHTLSGKAQIFDQGRWVNATVGSAVYADSSVQTGYNSRVIVMLRNGAQLALKPNTTLSFNNVSTGPAGSNVNVELVNGAVNSFIPKAEAGQINELKIRSATAVAGVRGSFISARRHGRHFAVRAVHSPATLEAAPPAEERELVRANLMTAVAQKEGVALQAEEAKACLQKDGTQASAAQQRLSDATTKAQVIDTRVNLLRMISAQQPSADAPASQKPENASRNNNNPAAQAVRDELRDMKKEDAQQRKPDGLGRAMPIAEGNGAATQGQRVITPFLSQLLDVRPNQFYAPGQTRMEGQFFMHNFDNQAGLGNDFQRLFNNINRFNQQGNIVVPSLRKF